ncbi:hypothetical protein P5673_019190 [Acropora cervicornis]|uniref:Uncharacterized protein n=1 Tax=Acropora cervicornis TaxID=6130 RepID=A0AAD9QBV9_ACRCE|nr:hypothetical protein P5673_019190 [Acropora cervicornis]
MSDVICGNCSGEKDKEKFILNQTKKKIIYAGNLSERSVFKKILHFSMILLLTIELAPLTSKSFNGGHFHDT